MAETHTGIELLQKEPLRAYLLSFFESELAVCDDPIMIRRMKRVESILKFLPMRSYERTDPIIASTLIKMRVQGRPAWYLLLPDEGGWVTSFEGHAVQLLSIRSELGAALLGRLPGDQFELRGRLYCIEAAH